MRNRDIRLLSCAGRVGFPGFGEAQPTTRPFTLGLGSSNPNCSIFSGRASGFGLNSSLLSPFAIYL